MLISFCIAGDVNGKTAMILLNAVYFKGDWKYKFLEYFTKLRTFCVDKNSKIKVPTMHLQENLDYGTLDDINAQYIALPYKV